MRALLTMTPKQHETGIILLREEFEGGGVGEGMYVVLLLEADDVRFLEGAEVAEEAVDQGAAACAAEEERRFGVFESERGLGF